MNKGSLQLGPLLCKRCGLRPITDFRRRKAYEYKGELVYSYRCIHCLNEYRKNRYHADPEASHASVRAWRHSNPEQAKKLQKDFWIRNLDKYQAMLVKMKRIREETRMRVLQHYSKGTPKCACCGESFLEFLAVDHIHGGGTQHRKQIHRTTHRFSLWLIKNNFPDGFRILCHNCNFSYGHFGTCIHQEIVK